jgi:hypothetical protein
LKDEGEMNEKKGNVKYLSFLLLKHFRKMFESVIKRNSSFHFTCLDSRAFLFDLFSLSLTLALYLDEISFPLPHLLALFCDIILTRMLVKGIPYALLPAISLYHAECVKHLSDLIV